MVYGLFIERDLGFPVVESTVATNPPPALIVWGTRWKSTSSLSASFFIRPASSSSMCGAEFQRHLANSRVWLGPADLTMVFIRAGQEISGRRLLHIVLHPRDDDGNRRHEFWPACHPSVFFANVGVSPICDHLPRVPREVCTRLGAVGWTISRAWRNHRSSCPLLGDPIDLSQISSWLGAQVCSTRSRMATRHQSRAVSSFPPIASRSKSQYRCSPQVISPVYLDFDNERRRTPTFGLLRVRISSHR